MMLVCIGNYDDFDVFFETRFVFNDFSWMPATFSTMLMDLVQLNSREL